MGAEEIVTCIDFRYIKDALAPTEALQLLRDVESGKAERIKEAERNRAVPTYTASAGWLGYDKNQDEGAVNRVC